VYGLYLTVGVYNAASSTFNGKQAMSKRKEDALDPDTIALLQWCAEVEALFVAAGAKPDEAQQQIEENAEWFTDMFFDGLSPEEAAKAALN
jgi:hypothetical protein